MKLLRSGSRGENFVRGPLAKSIPVFKNIKVRLVALLALVIAIGMVTFNAAALLNEATVTLAWDPSPDSTVTSYRVHYGLASNDLSGTLDVGNVTQVTVLNLAPGVLYYFTVTAYNGDGIESLDSNEVSYLTTGALSAI